MTEVIRDWVGKLEAPINGLTEVERKHFEEVNSMLEDVLKRQEATLKLIKEMVENDG